MGFPPSSRCRPIRSKSHRCFRGSLTQVHSFLFGFWAYTHFTIRLNFWRIYEGPDGVKRYVSEFSCSIVWSITRHRSWKASRNRPTWCQFRHNSLSIQFQSGFHHHSLSVRACDYMCIRMYTHNILQFDRYHFRRTDRHWWDTYSTPSG